MSKAMKWISVLVVVFLTGSLRVAMATSLVLGASQDAAIASGGDCGTPGFSWDDQQLGMGPHLLINPCDGAAAHGLIQFDLSSIMGSTISSATLTLYHEFNPQSAGRTASLFRNTSAWDELTVSYNTRPSFDAAAVATESIAGPDGDFHTWDLTAIVQAWVNSTHANMGLTLVLSPDTPPWPYLASKEHSTESFRPKLDVEHSAVPEPASIALLGGALGLLIFLRKRSS